jgi:hypothetical protein
VSVNVILFAFAVATIQAAATDDKLQFKCVGTSVGTEAPGPWKKTIEIDLKQQVYRIGKKAEWITIKQHSGSRVVFWDKAADGITSDGSPINDLAYLDLSTGQFRRQYTWNGRMHHQGEVQATCVKRTQNI